MQQGLIKTTIGLLPDISPANKSSYGHYSTSQRLGQTHDIRANPLLLTGKEGPGPAKTGLDFIDNQICMILITELPYCFQIALCGQYNTTLTLNGLHNKGSMLTIFKLMLQGINITKGYPPVSGKHGIKGLLILITSGY